MSSNYIYLLECSDKTLYTGWTNNLEHRIQKHNNGKFGAKSPYPLPYLSRIFHHHTITNIDTLLRVRKQKVGRER